MPGLTIGRIVILVGVIFLIGIGLGAWAMHSWYISDMREALAIARERLNNAEQLLYKEQQKPPVVKTETKTMTEIAYVPKETIIYRDPITGQTTTGQENVDVDFKVTPPNIWLKYNGELFELAGIAGEHNKFEQGKLTGEVSTAATVDVTDLVNKEVSLQRASDQKVLAARLNELNALKYRPQVDLVGGPDVMGGTIRINRVGLDYLRISGDSKFLLRYTILR